MASAILLKNGTLLIHDEDDHVVPTKADLLITGNTITRIAPDIPATDVGEVIDCTGKIVTPGFIDCHQHVWQTQLKGRHADELFLDYMPSGNFQSSNYTLSDFYWGQLGGCLELLNTGTTTVLDHAHMTTSPEAAPTAISATLTSGIRSIFAFTPLNQIASWHPTLTFSDSPSDGMLAPWVLDTFTALAARSPFGPGGRVSLGLAFDGWFLPRSACAPLFRAARAHGVSLLTTHMVRNATGNASSLPAQLREWGLLSSSSSSSSSPDAFPSVVFSHACGATPEDLAIMRETGGGGGGSGAHFASTPGTELQMALGRPLCFDEGSYELACVGGDCHSAGGASVVGELRLGLQAARGERNQRFIERGVMPRTVWRRVEEAFNLGTVKGARALGLAGRVGRLAEGMAADVVVWEGCSPGMVCAAQEDPVAAVVLHSSAQDVDVVVVDGVVRKRGGRLVQMRVEEDARGIVGKETVEWRDVARELVKSRESLKEKIQGLDLEAAKKVMMKSWYIDESKVVDGI